MSSRRQFVVWVVAAVGAAALLVGVMIWVDRYLPKRWGVFLVGDPETGADLFFGRKGCARCHSVGGGGGHLAPDLGYKSHPKAGLGELVTSMWNHAPKMWERMREWKITYPPLSDSEMAHLFAFLYTAKYVDEPGDATQGFGLFRTKGCIRCHGVRGNGGEIGPDLSKLEGVDTPIRWTQAMWNHAPAMEASMQKLGLQWPKFEGREMNDLLAYVRGFVSGVRRERELLPASPKRGWKVFQSGSCIVCHSVKGQGGDIGPALGPGQKEPPSIVQFAGLLWNHSPEMLRELTARGIPRPTFQGQEIADLVAFLASLRYFEPAGSPLIGEHVFDERGCSHCHGKQGEGTSQGPAVRGKREGFTSINLATVLWRHGPKMYRRAQELGLPWPTLGETDVGDLVSFINTPVHQEK